MNFSTLSLLCFLAWSLPFTLSFPSVECCKGLAEISQRSETPSVPHCEQASCLTSLHTVILWCTMRCPFILSMIGRLSATTSGVRLLRENQESSWICGNYPRDAQMNKLAFPRMERGSWLGVHREAALSLSGSVEFSAWQCWEFLLRVQQLECKVIESQTDPALWVKLHKSAF